MPDSYGAVRRLERVAEGSGEAGERPGVSPDVDRLAARNDGEYAGIAAGPAVGGDDRVPLPRARYPGDPRFDPAEGARIGEVAAQLSWGSMSP
jgi:hypothetical protein